MLASLNFIFIFLYFYFIIFYCFCFLLPIKMSLSIPATIISHKRSQRKIYPKYVLLRLSNVTKRANALSYLNNQVHYTRNGKLIPGVITKVHGNSGVLMAKFRTNLPPQDIGKECEVKLWKIEKDEL